MKILFRLAVGLLLISSARATVLVEDHFSYTNGNLGATGIGDTVWTAGDSPSVAIRVNSTAALSYPGLAGSAGSGVVFSGTTFKKRSASFTSQSNGTVYCSFLLNIQSAPASTKLFVWLHDAGGGTSSPGLGIFLNTNQLGLAKKASSPAVNSGSLGNGTHLIVARYTFQTGNDQVDLWVDPASLGDNGNIPAATLTTGTGSSSDMTSLSYLVLNHGIDQTLWIDEVRVGTTWAEVTPSAGVVVPPTAVPYVTNVWMATGGLVLRGTNGPTNGAYVVLASADVSLPQNQWRAIATNAFDEQGHFNCTNPVTAGVGQQFYRLLVGSSGPPVLVPPAITTQPTNQSAAVGQTATFNVVASGTAPLSYQWYFNTNTLLPNKTNAVLTLTNVQTTNAGGYSVVVANSAGSATSVVATLTVTNVAPSITTQPTNQTVGVDGNATFSVSATGTAPLSYQWYFNTDPPLTGKTNATLTLNNVQTNDAGGYSVVVANSAGSTTSVVAALTVTGPAAPSITTQPQNQAVTVGQTAVFSVIAGGTAPLSYQWYFNTNTPLADKTNATLIVTNVQTNDAGGYSIIVTNSLGSVTSVVATLTVSPAPTNGGSVQILQAEDGVFTGTVDSEYSGYTGTGYVNTENATGSYIEWEFGRQHAGTETLFVRYAHNKSDNRTASVTVNGVVVVSSMDFPPTGGWASWQVVSNTIPVQAGRNVLRLTALTSGGLANTDRIEISGDPQFKLKSY